MKEGYVLKMQDSESQDEMATNENNCVSEVHLNSEDIKLILFINIKNLAP